MTVYSRNSFEIWAVFDLDFDLEATGFEMGAIDLRIEKLSADTIAENHPADTSGSTTRFAVSRLGDLWELGVHRVCCGSALDPAAFKLCSEGTRQRWHSSTRPTTCRSKETSAV